MIKNIIWDFDGVIMDSMPIREKGFQLVLEELDYPQDQIDQLLEYHRINGGKSRFDKFAYFYNTILGKEENSEEVEFLTSEFSRIMKRELCNPELFIDDTLEFIETTYREYNMHIVSGSYDMELKYICHKTELSDLFITINGNYPSPESNKNDRVKEVIDTFMYDPKETVMIGDSMNDFDAAQYNDLHFLGFNPSEAMKIDSRVKIIDNYYEFQDNF